MSKRRLLYLLCSILLVSVVILPVPLPAQAQLNCLLDVVLVLDGSGSINVNEFAQVKDFAARVVNGLGLGSASARAGVVQFANTSRLEVGLSDQASAVNAVISGLGQTQGVSNTYIDRGLQAAHDHLMASTRPLVSRAIILLTDGVPSNQNRAYATADLVRSAGTRIFAVGVGNGIQQSILNRIASGAPTITQNTFTAADFNALANLVARINASVCAGMASITGSAFLDLNRNLVIDPGEAGIPNVTMQLLAASNGQTIATTTTSAQGMYTFSSLTAGAYRVAVVPPGNGFLSANIPGVTLFNPVTRQTNNLTIQTGVPIPNINVGLIVPVPDLDMVSNGNFSLGLLGWGFFNTFNQVVNGTLELARWQNTPEGGMFQFVDFPVPNAAPMELTFTMGNRSATTKAITFIVRNSSWSDMRRCDFWVNPFAPVQHYTMRFRTAADWHPIVVQSYVQTADSAPALLIDNMQLRYRPNLNVPGGTASSCTVEPPANTNLVYNGDFNLGLAGWGFSNLFAQVVPWAGSPVLEVARWQNTPQGLFYQFVPFAAPAGGVFELTFALGNRSNVVKTVNLLARDPAWSNIRSCFLTLGPLRPLANYTMRFRATTAWPVIALQGWLQNPDGLAAMQFDNLNLQYKPGLSLNTDVSCPSTSSGVVDSMPVAVDYAVDGSAPAQPTTAQITLVQPPGGLMGEGGVLAESITVGEAAKP